MEKNKLLVIVIALLQALYGFSGKNFSTAGFYAVPNSGREVYDFNVGWRFHLGDASGAKDNSFDDSSWEIVSTPHTIQLVPEAASGGKNYQGIVWYRKHFRTYKSFAGKKIWLHFEAIMGKSKIYVDGKLVKTHLGGFLPAVISLTDAGVDPDSDCVISVCADNSDDTSYPPGKSQITMDFSYFGGIYRDCWLYTTNDIHITDPNYTDIKAGGGIFATTEKVSASEAVVRIKTHLANRSSENQSIQVKNELTSSDGREKGNVKSVVVLKAGESKSVEQLLKVKNPALWHPNQPSLYTLKTSLIQKSKVCDAIETKIGIRTIEFIPDKGLSINGEIFKDKLLGVNRHQDFGYIGMAMTNNLHYADVKVMRDAGLRIIRSAHYPQDPAFMDACDQLGMFIIVATPGWQFWNNNGIFESLVMKDIRNMVRRDRNHPSVFLWEPILNETHYPASFSENAYNAVHEEYPAKGCYVACDDISKGSDRFDVIYTTPKNAAFYQKLGKCCFTREFGDCVDDWYSHNSYSRVSRDWSEEGLLFQAQHYAKKNYEGSLTIDELFKAPAAHIGGTLWHSFDHQRGYHPDPFYGGIMDVFRQPKYSYYMFQSQRNPNLNLNFADSGPVLYIANAMTPISPTDVTVYSNCDSVRLQVMKSLKKQSNVPMELNYADLRQNKFYVDTIMQAVKKNTLGLACEPVIFKNAFDFVTVRAMHRSKNMDAVKIIAEGIIEGKVVIQKTMMPSKRSDIIKLRIDSTSSANAMANGSDIIKIIASVEDERGYVKQLANEQIEFTVLGEGTIIGDVTIGANPARVVKGTAPLLVRTSTKAGKITVVAQTYFGGTNSPKSDTLVMYTKTPYTKLVYKEEPNNTKTTVRTNSQTPVMTEAERKKLQEKVEKDQQFFESTERKK